MKYQRQQPELDPGGSDCHRISTANQSAARKFRLIHHIKKIVFVFFTFAIVGTMRAQLSPQYDPNWTMNSNKSDEFDMISSGTNGLKPQWDVEPSHAQDVPMSLNNVILDPNYNTGTNMTPGAVRIVFTAISTSTGNGSLYPNLYPNNDYPGGSNQWWLKEMNDPDYGGQCAGDWKGGFIQTTPHSEYGTWYKYGYYEIRAKLPGYASPGPVNTTPYPCHYNYPCMGGPNNFTQRGIIPQFWLTREVWCDSSTNCNSCVVNEVDIMEGDGYTNKDFAINTHWWGNCQCVSSPDCQNNPCFTCKSQATKYPGNDWDIPNNIDAVHTWHKYGLQLMPDRMIVFFDDDPIQDLTFMQPAGIPTNNLSVTLDLAFTTPYKGPGGPYAPGTGWLEPCANVTPIAANSNIEFVIDYFRYYEYQTSNCNLNRTILTNNDLLQTSGVWKNINVGNANTIISMAQMPHKVLRHTADVTVLGEFTVPLLSELSVFNASCP